MPWRVTLVTQQPDPVLVGVGYIDDVKADPVLWLVTG
jgi:hypothetical protein